MSEVPRPALHSARASPAGPRRTAPQAQRTSDVTRFVGVLAAVLAAAVVLAAGLFVFLEPSAERSAGPLSRPHVGAGVGCAQCHETGGPPQDACSNCHGAHASVRGPHQALRERGALRCIDCHRVHRDLGGVSFDGAGGAVVFSAQNEIEVPLAPPIPPTTVASPPAGACGRCHRLDDARDPIARCLILGQDALGDQRPTVCFDEHRPLVGATLGRGGDAGERLVAWTAARDILASTPLPPVAPAKSSEALWAGLVAASLFVGVVVFVLVRAIRGANVVSAEDPVAMAPPKRQRLPVIDETTCIGCSACVDACPYDVLVLERYVAKLARPDDCCGLTLCEQKCPNGSLVVTDGAPLQDRPRIDDALQSLDQPGLFIAGDLTGLPLIRNAINQGAAAMTSIASSLPPRRDAGQLDVLIVGAGPAGLSAALRASELGLRYKVLEQGSVAQSIRSFPRGKLVFDQPLGIPKVGDLWLEEATKEELLGKWLRIVRANSVDVAEQHRVVGVESTTEHGGGFWVQADAGEVQPRFFARRVLLALGKRGTPRLLDADIPEAMVDHVHYSLADAQSFAGKRVVVVGLGDVAMETAIAIAGQRETTVTVSYRGPDFSRGKRRNIEEVRRLAQAGRIDLQFSTTVTQVEPGSLVLGGPQGSVSVACDAVFVMIGAIAPWDFLSQAGLRRSGGEPAVVAEAAPASILSV